MDAWLNKKISTFQGSALKFRICSGLVQFLNYLRCARPRYPGFKAPDKGSGQKFKETGNVRPKRSRHQPEPGPLGEG
jgi:hypothetical protein